MFDRALNRKLFNELLMVLGNTIVILVFMTDTVVIDELTRVDDLHSLISNHFHRC